MEKAQIKALLAIENRPNSFFPINLNDLGDHSPFVNDLTYIDVFTATTDEDIILKRIADANIVPNLSEKASLAILIKANNGKDIKLPVLTKGLYDNYNLNTNFPDIIKDKELVNVLIEKLNRMKIADAVKSALIICLRNGSQSDFFEIYTKLDYLTTRRIYFLIINEYIERLERQTRIREKSNQVGE